MSFTKLIEDVIFAGKEIGDAEQGDQKWKSIATQLRSQSDDNFLSLLNKWEQASQMRKWTQKAKLLLSERITVEVDNQLRTEIRTASADKKPFTDPLNDE